VAKSAELPPHKDAEARNSAASSVESQRCQLAKLIGRLVAMRWLKREGILAFTPDSPPAAQSRRNESST